MTTITDEAPTFGRQGALEWLSIDVVIPSDMNPRKDFSAAALATLRDSMTRYGQLQPSIVQPYKPNANTVLYRLVEGERRYHTAKKIGMKEIPCLVVHRSLSDHDELELMFQIHGEADRTLPIGRTRPDVVVPGGSHALTLFNAAAVNEFLGRVVNWSRQASTSG